MQNIILAFTTGITAGGISCFAVQGGLLASTISDTTNAQKKVATMTFLLAKLAAYTILGFLLGAFGSKLSISLTLQGWLQIFAGLYMIATAANILELHPIFRYTVIQPPKWAYKFLKKESQQKALGPVILGALTVLIPCGITQGMMILAISSGNALLGAAILFAFTLGTSPIFLLIGLTASQFMKRRSFVYVASLLILLLGINSISAGNALRGSVHTLGNYWAIITNPDAVSESKALATIDNSGVQHVSIEVTGSGYKTSATALRANIPVKINFSAKNAAGCVQVFTIPEYNIKKLVPQTGTEELTFTPTKKGLLSFSCAMGMYTGAFQVI